MASRRKRDRRATSPARATQPTTPRVPSTYRHKPARIATAQQQLRVDLSGLDVLTPAGEGRPNPTRGGVPLRRDQGATVVQGAAKRSPRQETKRNAEQVSINEPRGVKCRPDGRKPSGAGAGGSRQFVPWNGKDCK